MSKLSQLHEHHYCQDMIDKVRAQLEAERKVSKVLAEALKDVIEIVTFNHASPTYFLCKSALCFYNEARK